jgi:Secretion system C-terminal sorting domain
MRIPFIFTLLLLAVQITAQPHISKSFFFVEDGNGDAGWSIQREGGGYLLLGGRNDFTATEWAALARLDDNFDFTWKKDYYLTNQENPPDVGGPESMVVMNDKVYIANQTYSEQYDFDLQLLCLDKYSGDTLWSRIYHQAGNNITLALAMTTDSNLVALTVYGVGNIEGNWLVKLNKDNGDMLWSKIHNEFDRTRPWGLRILPDGAILMSYNSLNWGEEEAGSLTKFNTSGNKIWTKTYTQTTDNRPSLVTPLNNGDLAFTYGRDTTFPGWINLYERPCWVAILDSIGNVKHRHTFWANGAISKQINSLRTLSNGDILGIGSADMLTYDLRIGGWLFRMSPHGELLWERTIIDDRFEQQVSKSGFFLDASETYNGDIVAVGTIRADPPTYTDGWLLTIGADGCYNGNCMDGEFIITSTSQADTYLPVQIFPNPATSHLMLQYDPSIQIVQADILDISGRVLQTIPQPGPRLDLSDIVPGYYLLRLTNHEGRQRTDSFIKQ